MLDLPCICFVQESVWRSLPGAAVPLACGLGETAAESGAGFALILTDAPWDRADQIAGGRDAYEGWN
jgi:hypothetical protein